MAVRRNGFTPKNINMIFTIKIGGEAGQGIKSAGLVLAKLATRSGYHIFTHTEYGSVIRGGHNVMQINVSAEAVTAPRKETDFLIALNQETINRYSGELTSNPTVIFESGRNLDVTTIAKNSLCPVPLAALAKEVGSGEMGENLVALGVAAALLGGDLETLKNLIDQNFPGGGKAAQVGFDFAAKSFPKNLGKILAPSKKIEPKLLVNGNQALAMGAIAGGLQFAAIYPMTPITGLLQELAALQNEYGFVYKQSEDELAAVNMAIGASFAGARSLVATSGGGFCLMTEGLGLAAMTETPLVIVEGMRPGPATGLPTWSGQGDLQFVLHAHQGEFPRFVLAAGDAKEAFLLTQEALDLAEKYQIPVVLLVDKNLCESDQSFTLFDVPTEVGKGKRFISVASNYERYALAQDGVSPRALPGSGNFFITNSDEHDSVGYSSEIARDHIAQTRKRQKKLATCEKLDMPPPIIFGPAKADVTIVSWGSNKGAILEALKNFKNVNFLHLTWLSPFPTEAAASILSKSRHIVDVEANYGGQLASLIREKTGIEITDCFLKYDGRPFYPEEITEKINSALGR